MIQLHIEADDVHVLHEKLKGILYGLAVEPAQKIETEGVEAQKSHGKTALEIVNEAAKGARAEVAEAPKVEPKKRGRPAKAEAAPQPEPEKPAEPAEETKSVEVPSIDDLRRSLMQLANAEGHGSEAVFELLGKYNAKNASTVPEDKRVEVIAAVNEKLAEVVAADA